MSKLRKILITPYFGKFPEWMDKFEPPVGYDWLLDTDLLAFDRRVKKKLGFWYPGKYGSGKIWDYRCALGYLYEEEIKGFDYWGTMDFDVVWGHLDAFYPDSMISGYDVISGHNTYVNGCFSLYRNCKEVNELFKRTGVWTYYMGQPEANGWVENGYSRILEQSELRYKYTFYQGDPWTKNLDLRKKDQSLFQLINNEWREIAFFHFRHFKRWPL